MPIAQKNPTNLKTQIQREKKNTTGKMHQSWLMFFLLLISELTKQSRVYVFQDDTFTESTGSVGHKVKAVMAISQKD